jgi:BirA family biotin operon repressor/biotin-[acetyl-CoA-carboxylase] ligase
VPAPSPSLQRLADGPSFWHTVDHHDVTGSTNDLALDKVRDGAAPGYVVLADRQTEGRGRHGRSWEDRPDGASVAVSVTIPPLTDHRTLVPLVAGVALTDSLRRLGLRAGLKWPNDVLLELPRATQDEPRELRKVAGILAEALSEGIVIGVGMNVDFRGLDPVEGATSVAEVLGRDVDRWQLTQKYLRALEAWFRDLEGRGPVRLLGSYQQRCATLGQDVRATVADGPVEGRATSISPTGGLVLTLAGGDRVEVTSGEVLEVRRSG